VTETSAPTVTLSCHPCRNGKHISFPYHLENHGPGDIYVMDALPAVEPDGNVARANDQNVVTILRGEDEAVLGKYLAPVPSDRRVMVPVTPLARLLKAGAALDGKLDVRLPLAETSPYLPDLMLRSYDPVELTTIVFALNYWPTTVPGLFAMPAEYAPDHLVLVARQLKAGVKFAWQRFPAKGLQLLKRNDAFPRSVLAA
jgi:hypothetical protein